MKRFQRKWQERYPQSKIAANTKIVDSFDTFKAVHILQFVHTEIKIVDRCKTSETVHILQLVVVEIKTVDSSDASETVHIL